MYVLDKLWRGEISPNEKYIHRDREYHQALSRLCEIEEKLSAELNDDAKTLFNQYADTYSEMVCIENREMFIDAFRLGAEMILDVVNDRKEQFYT